MSKYSHTSCSGRIAWVMTQFSCLDPWERSASVELASSQLEDMPQPTWRPRELMFVLIMIRDNSEISGSTSIMIGREIHSDMVKYPRLQH